MASSITPQQDNLPPGNSEQPPTGETNETAEIAHAAGILAMGNITSRVLGIVRETVLSHFFGAGGLVSAYGIASLVPRTLYDLLIGGMVNGALVPVFSAYAEESREDLWKLVNTLLSITVIVLASVVLLGELLAPRIAFFMLGTEVSPDIVELATRLLRVTFPAVLFLSLAGVLSGLLYSLRRFTYPAFTAAAYNAAIVIIAVLFYREWSIMAMAVGLLIGAVAQVVLQVPGLRMPSYSFRPSLWHPGLRRVAVLYIPSLAPLVVDMVSRFISYRFASLTGEGGIAYLNYATYLTQLPQGLVAIAVSLAVLPTLSAHASRERGNGASDEFKDTLSRGLRLVIALIVPASVGLYILAQPTVALIYEHGTQFLPTDTLITAWALRFYLLGLPFAAVDLLLVFTFYARQDTLTPALIGIGSIVAYLLLAAGLLPTWGLFGLMIADSFKHLLHTLISGLLLWRRLGGFGRHSLYRTSGIVVLGSAVMAVLSFYSLKGILALLPSGGLTEVVSVAVPGLLGLGSYLLIVSFLKIQEIQDLWATARRKLTSR